MISMARLGLLESPRELEACDAPHQSYPSKDWVHVRTHPTCMVTRRQSGLPALSDHMRSL
jgi:hypothetical protein